MDNVADDDLPDALELDLAGSHLLTLSIPQSTTILCRKVLGAMVMLKLSSQKVHPGAQADRSSEPAMAVSQVVPEVRPSARTQAGFAVLDVINVRDIFTQRVCVMKVPPALPRGAHRSMRTALLEITSGMELSNNTRVVRGWKLFVLLPRMLLFNPPRGGKVSKHALMDRFTKFPQGQWFGLLTQGVAASAAAIEMDGFRGETGRTCRGIDMFGYFRRRPPKPRDPIPDVIVESEPVHPFEMDMEMFMQNLRTARRRAAGGPSGMRNSHLRPLLAMSQQFMARFEECHKAVCIVHQSRVKALHTWCGAGFDRQQRCDDRVVLGGF